MEVTFVMEPDDVWVYYRRVLFPRQLRRLLVTTLIAGAFVFYLTSSLGEPIWMAATSVVAVVLVYLFSLLTLKPRVAKQAALTPGVLGQQTVSLRPEALRRQTPLFETIVPWTSYTQITDAGAQILFFFNSTSAQAVPKRAFVSPQEAREFLDAALAYWRSAREGTPPPALAASQTWPPPPRR